MSKINTELVEFHKKYNQIFKEQNSLPTRKSRVKDNSTTETIITDMSNNLITELRNFKANLKGADSNCFVEIDNMISGCEKLIINPYIRSIGGIIDLEEVLANLKNDIQK